MRLKYSVNHAINRCSVIKPLLFHLQSAGKVVAVQSLSCVQLYATPQIITHQAPIHGISQTRLLEWVAISFYRGSCQPSDQTCISCLASEFFIIEQPGKPSVVKNLPANAGDTGDSGSIPRSGRYPRGGNGNHSSLLARKIPWTE